MIKTTTTTHCDHCDKILQPDMYLANDCLVVDEFKISLLFATTPKVIEHQESYEPLHFCSPFCFKEFLSASLKQVEPLHQDALADPSEEL